MQWKHAVQIISQWTNIDGKRSPKIYIHTMIWHRTETFQFLSWLWGDRRARIWEWVPKLTVTLSTYYSLSTSVRGQGPWSLLVACAYISCPHILTIACCSPPRDVQHKMHIYDYDVRGLECNLKTQVGLGGEMVIGSSTSFAWSCEKFSKRERW